jgi:hypothetical protein
MFALVPLAQAAVPSHVAIVDLGPKVQAYDHAANLHTLTTNSGFELRVWSRDYMSGRVGGTVVANGQLRTLDTSSKYEHDKVIIEHAPLSSPSPVSNLRKLETLVEKLEPRNGTSVSCGVMDGGSVLVHAVVHGHTIMIEANNPSLCADKASKIIVQLLHGLQSQASQEVSPNKSSKADASGAA